MGSVVVAHELSCSVACGIFLDQGSNLWPPHWQANSYPLQPQKSASRHLKRSTILDNQENTNHIQGPMVMSTMVPSHVNDIICHKIMSLPLLSVIFPVRVSQGLEALGDLLSQEWVAR